MTANSHKLTLVLLTLALTLYVPGIPEHTLLTPYPSHVGLNNRSNVAG